MKDVLIISNYFPPEIGAASNRIFQLAKGLSKNHNVTVLCPFPNYPTGRVFKDFKKQETIESIKIKRLWIYPSASKNKLVRLFSMLSFSFNLIGYFIGNKLPKTVIVNSPPLLVAFVSLFCLDRKKFKLILNVSDLWPKAGLELQAIKKGFSYKILEDIEAYNYKKADLILGQSEEILAHIKTIVPKTETLLYRNFPDFNPPLLEAANVTKSKKITLVYAGLLGVAQGILKLCENLDFSNIEFHIYGSGAEKNAIIDFIEKHPEKPITFHGSLPRKELHTALLKYDATIIPLLNRIYGSVPSKIFEYARLGLPIIYFGGGEGETIIKNYKLGRIANAGDYAALNAEINSLKKEDFNLNFKKKIQETAVEHFKIENQFEALNAKI